MRKLAPVHESVPNLAPMVDVIMVLLIFFLLGASLDLVHQGILQTELDDSSGPGGGAAIQVNPLIRIALQDIDDGQGAEIFVMEEPLADNTFDGLLRYLEARRRAGADPNNIVVIGADTTTRWRFVIQAMDAAVRAGFHNVQFAVSFRKPGTPGP
ncbi:MAG: biopolymer transporter ExbD [Phycisphaerae bacterium]|jgi:biopolymer transport protein ExbD